MDFNHRHLSPALGAHWTLLFCKLLILKEWSGRKDLNLRPPGPEPGALARLRYAPTADIRARKLSPEWKIQNSIARGPNPRVSVPVLPGGCTQLKNQIEARSMKRPPNGRS